MEEPSHPTLQHPSHGVPPDNGTLMDANADGVSGEQIPPVLHEGIMNIENGQVPTSNTMEDVRL